MKRTLWTTLILCCGVSWIGAQDGPAVKPAKTLTHLGCKGLSEEDKRKLVIEIIALLPKGTSGTPGPQGPRGAEGPPGTISKLELTSFILELIEKNKAALKGDPGTNGTNGTNGEAGKKPTREELLVLIREVVLSEKETLKGADGKPADETKITELKTEIENMKAHTFKLLIKDKDGRPTKNRDGSDNATTFGFGKDGELWLIDKDVK